MNRIESIHVAPTSTQRALPSRFDAALRGAAEGLVRGVAATVELAAPIVPGGTILSAAIRSGAAAAGGSPLGGSPLAGGLTGSPGGGAGGDVLDATRALQREAQTFNLQYLQLQEHMQRESREFTAVSNVMKVRHDSARAAIQNIH
ncbi:conserved hypothetical protein [Anaeromyxobacter sp. K]|uniref:hypothetical protein n=1 Tax=Anaeromyxobacter sp. (strain K) TaxID=447217 RepID=UPI00015F8EC8|nr:hypothetical protein [Anaeromyxobacter sp. K]ACG71983.1 conserved hypothetical protein [Anaeromyxobacter sp. K]